MTAPILWMWKIYEEILELSSVGFTVLQKLESGIIEFWRGEFLVGIRNLLVALQSPDEKIYGLSVDSTTLM